MIDQGKFGEIYKGVVWYSKGFINNGSHFIDLLRWFFGEISSVNVIKNGRKWDNKDPEPDLCVCFGNTEIYMLAGREEKYYMGSFDMVASGGAVTYIDGQDIKIQYAKDDPIYPKYKSLSKISKIANPSERNIWYLYENLVNHFESSASIPSNLDTATATLSSVMEIIYKLRGE